MYHWEADQEDFLVLAGEGVLVIEGQERPLRRWDFVHCPAGTEHVIVAAGERAPGRAVQSAPGASRPGPTGVPTRWTPRPGATAPASTQETTDERIAYARFPEPQLHELPAGFAA